MWTPRTMKFINRRTREMKCEACGSHHFAKIRPNSGGKYYADSWRCVNRCRVEMPAPARTEESGALRNGES